MFERQSGRGAPLVQTCAARQAREANLARVAPQHLQAALAVRRGPRLQDTRVRQGSDCPGPARPAHASSCARLPAHTRAFACAPAHVFSPARLPWNTLSEHNRASDCLGSAHARQPRAHARQPGHTRALVCLAHTRVCCLGTTGVATATKLSPRCFGPRPRSALNQDLAFNGTWPRCRFTPSLLNHSVSSPRGS